VSFDSEVDAAYIALGDTPIGGGEVKTTVRSILTPGGSEINLDFDAAGRLLGLEVLNATEVLPGPLLAGAEPPPFHADWWQQGTPEA
jgi:uncharacterized protein YuzE